MEYFSRHQLYIYIYMDQEEDVEEAVRFKKYPFFVLPRLINRTRTTI